MPKCSKAVGYDSIHPSLIIDSAKEIGDPLTTLIYHC